MTDWDLRFYRIAHLEVAGWSKDPDEKVGCLVVSPDRRRWTGGYNGFPRGVKDTHERLHNKELKNRLTVHAEQNAIDNAHTDLTGWTLYSTKAPCSECAKSIIQNDLARVVSPGPYTGSSWYADQYFAEMLLREAGVQITYIQEEHGCE